MEDKVRTPGESYGYDLFLVLEIVSRREPDQWDVSPGYDVDGTPIQFPLAVKDQDLGQKIEHVIHHGSRLIRGTVRFTQNLTRDGGLVQHATLLSAEPYQSALPPRVAFADSRPLGGDPHAESRRNYKRH